MKIKRIIACFLLFFLMITPAWADNGETIVHKTRTGECYHRAGCSYLKSDIEVTLREAVNSGLRPCSRCKPPKLEKTENANSNKSMTATWNNSSQNTVTPKPVHTPLPSPTQTQSPYKRTTLPATYSEQNDKAIGTLGYAAAAGLGGFVLGRKKKKR